MSDDIEHWRPVVGFPDYAVSDRGRVRRETIGRGTKPGRILTPDVRQNGYLRASLTDTRGTRGHYIHRLVAQAFLEQPSGFNQVNHKNCDKTDNRPINLEWCTHLDNMAHAYANGRYPAALFQGSRHWNSSFTDEKVRQIRLLFDAGMPSSEIARRFGYERRTVHGIATRQRWKHVD
jgi:hypothetical protein